MVNSKYIVNGRLRKNIMLVNSRLYLRDGARVHGSIFSWRSHLTAHKGSRVMGDIFAMDSGTRIRKGSKVQGNKYIVKSDSVSVGGALEGLIKDKPLLNFIHKIRLGKFLTIFLLSFLHAFFPAQFLKVAQTAFTRPFLSFGWGVLGAIGAPLILVVLTLSVIGIFLVLPFIVILSIIFLQGVVASAIVFGQFFRHKLLIKPHWVWLEILLGLIFIWALRLIPFYGKYIYVLIVLLGMGAAVLSLLGTRDILKK
ncbi:hypothetical protein ACFL5G_05365 [Candidatus Margulisiibacteriota bacterium]